MRAEEPLQVGNACTRNVLLWESDVELHPVESGDLSEIQVSRNGTESGSPRFRTALTHIS